MGIPFFEVIKEGNMSRAIAIAFYFGFCLIDTGNARAATAAA